MQPSQHQIHGGSTTTTPMSPSSSIVKIVGNVSELDEDSVGEKSSGEVLEKRSVRTAKKKKVRGGEQTVRIANKENVNAKKNEEENNSEIPVRRGKKYLKNDDHSLPINFREVDRQWRGVECKHQSISEKYEVDGVSTTLKAIKEHLDSENGEVKKTSVPLRVRHRFWKDLSHLDDCNTRFVLIEKNLVRAEKQKKDLRKEEEQQIAVGYRFRMFGKAKLLKPKITTGKLTSNTSIISHSPIKGNKSLIKEIPILEPETFIELPYDLSLSDYLSFIREKRTEGLIPPNTDRSDANSPRTPAGDSLSLPATPRSILTKRKTETKVIEKIEIPLKTPSLFDQVVNVDNKTREQIEREVTRKYKEKMRKYGNQAQNRNHDISTSNIPSVFQSLSSINNRLNPNRDSPPLSITPDEELLRRKRSEIGLLKKSLASQLDAHHPLFYIFRMRLVNFSASEFKLLKTKFNISISQLRSPHYIHIDTFKSNLFVTLYNQSVNEMGYFVPEYHLDDCVFACSECLPWLNESTVKTVLDQHLRITIHDCLDLGFPLFDFIVSFSEKERLFVVAHHLVDAPHNHQASDNADTYSARDAKYEFLKKHKFNGKPKIDEHMQEHAHPRQFLFVTFGDKDSPSSNRFDFKCPPTINLVSYPKKANLTSRAISPTKTLLSKIPHQATNRLDISFDDQELIQLETPISSKYNEVQEELDSDSTDEYEKKVPTSRKTKRYFDFSKTKRIIPFVPTYHPSASELVEPCNPSINASTAPLTYYSHETNKTILISSGKEKNTKVTLPLKRIPHTSQPVVDARSLLPKPVRFGALDNTQKILKEQRTIFKEQQKSGALGMIDFANFDEIRKAAPSTEHVELGNRKLSVAIEQ